jgi:hypothetical protein
MPLAGNLIPGPQPPAHRYTDRAIPVVKIIWSLLRFIKAFNRSSDYTALLYQGTRRTNPYSDRLRGCMIKGNIYVYIFFFSVGPRLAVGPTQPPVQFVLWALSVGVRQHDWSSVIILRGSIPPLIQIYFRCGTMLRAYSEITRKASSLRSRCLTKLRGLSPRANFTDRTTAACRRS